MHVSCAQAPARVAAEWLDGTTSLSVHVPADRPVDLWACLVEKADTHATHATHATRDTVFMLAVQPTNQTDAPAHDHSAPHIVWPWMYTHITLQPGVEYVATVVLGCTSQATQLQRLRDGERVSWDWFDPMGVSDSGSVCPADGQHGLTSNHTPCHVEYVQSFFAQVHKAADTLESVPIEWRNDLGYMTYVMDREVVPVWNEWNQCAPLHILTHVPLTIRALERDPWSIQQFPAEMKSNLDVAAFVAEHSPWTIWRMSAAVFDDVATMQLIRKHHRPSYNQVASKRVKRVLEDQGAQA